MKQRIALNTHHHRLDIGLCGTATREMNIFFLPLIGSAANRRKEGCVFSPRFSITVEQKCRVRMQRSQGIVRENNRGGMSDKRVGRMGGNSRKVARRSREIVMESLTKRLCILLWFSSEQQTYQAVAIQSSATGIPLFLVEHFKVLFICGCV